MRVLVTRPQPDADTTAADLRRRGHEPVIASLLTTQFTDWGEFADLPPPEALIATSLNGLRGLGTHPDLEDLRKLPLFVVGDSSARLAAQLGFQDVRPGQGSAADVIDRIVADMKDPARFLYAAGADRTGDIAGQLDVSGHRVDLVEIYRAVPIDRLPDSIEDDLWKSRIDRILIFSARTAETLVSVLGRAGLMAVSRSVPIHVISMQAAAPIISAGFQSVIVALRPDAAELLDTLER